MSEGQVEKRIREFVIRTFPLARGKQLTAGEKLLEAGILDSLGVLELVGFVEREFGIHVSDEDLFPENFQTIDRLTAYVQKKSLEKASGPNGHSD